MDTREYRNSAMPEPITDEELKEAIELWAPKFNLIREMWPGASIEESLKLMAVIEGKADEIKEEKKDSMGFSALVPKYNKSKAESKVQANSPYNDGWTQQYFKELLNDPPEKKVKSLSHTEKVRQFDLKQEKKAKKSTREFKKT